jgi:hypothetical protein
MRWVCPALLLSACSPVVPALRPRAEQIKPVVAQSPLAAALALAINGGSEEVRAAAWEQAGRAYIQLAVAEASAFAQRRAQQDAIGACIARSAAFTLICAAPLLVGACLSSGL